MQGQESDFKGIFVQMGKERDRGYTLDNDPSLCQECR